MGLCHGGAVLECLSIGSISISISISAALQRRCTRDEPTKIRGQGAGRCGEGQARSKDIDLSQRRGSRRAVKHAPLELRILDATDPTARGNDCLFSLGRKDSSLFACTTVDFAISLDAVYGSAGLQKSNEIALLAPQNPKDFLASRGENRGRHRRCVLAADIMKSEISLRSAI